MNYNYDLGAHRMRSYVDSIDDEDAVSRQEIDFRAMGMSIAVGLSNEQYKELLSSLVEHAIESGIMDVAEMDRLGFRLSSKCQDIMRREAILSEVG